MSYIILLSQILLIVRMLRVIPRNLGLWQVKEYRLDRMLIHYRKTQDGQSELSDPINIFKWIIFFMVLIFPNNYLFLVFVLLQFMDTYKLLEEIQSRTLKRPKNITNRIRMAVFISIFLVFFILILDFSGSNFFPILLADRLMSTGVALSIGITAVPAIVYKKFTIYRAVQKRKSLPNLKVVGITGSVGKTSTKYFLNSILSQKFRTVSTQFHDNTDIGIARRILKDISNNTEVFIAEMGAYKMGEIKYLCQIAKPQFGVLTHIGSQHLDLFGSQENIQKAKLELIENLNGERVAIINLDSPLIKSKLDYIQKIPGNDVVTYSTLESAQVQSKEIKQEKDGITFTIIIENKAIKVKANVYGTHFISNILAACATGWKMGMTIDEIKEGINNIKNPPDAVNKLKGPKESILFDDTYNASPESVEANISLLNSYPGIKNRILILQPMIELGEETNPAHIKIGEYLKDNKLDLLILTNSNFHKLIIEGAGENKVKVKVTNNVAEIEDILKSEYSSSTGIIFKGKESATSLKRISI